MRNAKPPPGVLALRPAEFHEPRTSPMAAPFPPPGAADCHVHVIGPKSRFPLAKERTYTPMDAPTAQLAAMLKRLGLDRVVLVQPSFYGTDNSCMLDCMAAIAG